MVEKKEIDFNSILVRLYRIPEVSQGLLEPAIRTICESCANALDLDRVAVWQMGLNKIEYQSIDIYDRTLKTHTTGASLPFKRFPIFQSTLSTQRLISSHDVSLDHYTSELSDLYWKLNKVQTAISVPILIRGTVAGFISYESIRPDYLITPEIESFACQIADLAASIIQTKHTQELQQQLESFETTLQNLTRQSSPDAALHDNIRTTTILMHCDSGMLYQSDPIRRECRCTVGYNIPPDLSGATLRFGEDAAGKVAETGHTLIIQDYLSWPERTISLLENQITAMMAIPLWINDQVAGVMQVLRADHSNPFTIQDRKVLENQARQAAMILEQLQLIENQSQKFTQTKAFSEILKICLGTTDFGISLDTSLDLLLESLSLNKGTLRSSGLIISRAVTQEDEHVISSHLIHEGAGFQVSLPIDNWKSYSGSLSELVPLMESQDILASLFVPLTMDRTEPGFIALHSSTPRKWSREDIQLVEFIAGLIGLASDKQGYRDIATLQKRYINDLYAIDRELIQLLPFNGTIEKIGQGYIGLTRANASSVFILTPEISFQSPWSHGISQSQLDQVLDMESGNIAQWISGFQKPTSVSIALSAEIPDRFKAMLVNEGFQSITVLPLSYAEHGFGVIMAFHQLSHYINTWEERILEVFSSQASTSLQNAWMRQQMEEGYTDIALALARVMDARDSSIENTSLQVAYLAEETALKLGLTRKEIQDLHWASLLHNIGKITVPTEILQKSETLSDEDWRTIHQYPVKGEELVQPLSHFHNVGRIIRNSRERFDGGGYPDQRKGNEIPLAARILSVADAFDSMITNRPYRRARQPQEALLELQRESGAQFDPMVVSAFIEVFRSPKIQKTYSHN